MPHPKYVAGGITVSQGKNWQFSRKITWICHTGVVGHFITIVSTFSDCRARINQ
jgi:hypothetical protein